MAEHLNVPYFLITFTLPHEYAVVFHRQPKDAVGIFFKAAAESIKQAFDSKFHGEAAFLMAYQSWTRDGNFHPHIHVIVAGGALAPDSSHWIHLRNPEFLFHSKAIEPVFSARFRKAVYPLESSRNIPKKAFGKRSVIDIKHVGNGVNAIKYIAAYTQRGFLSERDILSYDGKNVTFRFRSHEFAEDGHCKTLTKTVDAVKFLRLYFQHVLPKGVQRFCYGGIWASCSRAKLHAAQSLLNIVKTVDAVNGYIEKEFIPEVRRSFECPKCHCLSTHWIFYNTS
jgi:hypothetical protein